MSMRIIVAVTAASGSVYAKLLLQRLVSCSQVEKIALIFSDNARAVARYEGVEFPCSEKIEEYSNSDFFCSVASGSAGWTHMCIIPSTVGTMARVANGLSQTLIERAADVMLKERRSLILVLRETPFSLIHIKNMELLTQAGAVILPASPSFYSRPQNIDQLCMTVIERVEALMGLDTQRYSFKS